MGKKGEGNSIAFKQTEEKFQACARKVAFSNCGRKWFSASGTKSVVIIMEHYNMKKSGAVRYTMLENSSITLLSVTP